MFRLSKRTAALSSQIIRSGFNGFSTSRKFSTKSREEYSTQGFSIQCPPNTTFINGNPKTKFFTKLMFFLLGMFTGFAISDCFNMQLQYKSPADLKFDLSLGSGLDGTNSTTKDIEGSTNEATTNEVLMVIPGRPPVKCNKQI